MRGWLVARIGGRRNRVDKGRNIVVVVDIGRHDGREVKEDGDASYQDGISGIAQCGGGESCSL
jgi:hypothetical protein